jgi:hypothetical protein
MAAATLSARDGATGSHSDDVVHLCDAIADQLGVYGEDRAELLAAAQLHDIGKVAVPLDLLEKRGALDDEEWELIRGHTVAGEKIVRSVPELEEVAPLVRHSHERWDGSGYPDGLAGEDIPLGSRIVFCADSFHAIRSDRPYRRGRSAGAALDEVARNAGSQFDPRVAEALVQSAGQMRTKARSGVRGLTTATLRSRRLVTLLATLAIGASALAAGGSFVSRDDESDPPSRQQAPAAGSPADGATARSSRREGEERKGGGEPTTHGAERGGGHGAGSSSSGATRRRGASSAPATGAPARSGPPAAMPRRRRTGRPASPGRSGEAPGRPAQPGKPTGGAPGRSEEAPGRPAQPVTPPARPVTPPKGPATDRPGAGAPGNAKSR